MFSFFIFHFGAPFGSSRGAKLDLVHAIVVLRNEECPVGIQLCHLDGLPGDGIGTLALNPLYYFPSLVAMAAGSYNRVREPI